MNNFKTTALFAKPKSELGWKYRLFSEKFGIVFNLGMIIGIGWIISSNIGKLDGFGKGVVVVVWLIYVWLFLWHVKSLVPLKGLTKAAILKNGKVSRIWHDVDVYYYMQIENDPKTYVIDWKMWKSVKRGERLEFSYKPKCLWVVRWRTLD